MKTSFLRGIRALEDRYYAVSPDRRMAAAMACRAQISKNLVIGHEVVRDFDRAWPTLSPLALSNVAKVNRVRYLRPWEWVTHLFRGVEVFEFMLMYWLHHQRWLPQPVFQFLLIGIALDCTQYRQRTSRQRYTLGIPDGILEALEASQQERHEIRVGLVRWWQWRPVLDPVPVVGHAARPPNWLPSVLTAAVLFLSLWIAPESAARSVLVVGALSGSTVWEVRTTGSSVKNGGGFVTGAAGTDWSQQTNPQYAVTDGVTAGTTTVTSATANFGTDVVGNLIFIEGGTGAVTGDWYQITARASSVSITVDRSTGLTAGTGVTLNIGGAIPDPAIFTGKLVAGQRVFQCSGTYSITSATPNVAGGCVHMGAVRIVWEGYQTIRGDLGTKPVLSASGISTAILFGPASSAGNDVVGINIEVDGNSLTSIAGFQIGGGARGTMSRCKATECTDSGVTSGGASAFVELFEATGCLTAGAGIDPTAATMMTFASYCHDNSVPGFGAGSVTFSVSDTNTGDGFTDGGLNGGLWLNCSSYGNTGDGADIDAGGNKIINFIAESNGGFGLVGTTTTFRQNYASYNNTSGATSGTFLYSQTDIVGSASFFVDPANGNFALNTLAGGGALARAAGIPGAFPGGLTTGYLDVGAAQHQDPAGGGGVAIFGG